MDGNPPVTQFSVYGSAHVGIFGATVEKTNVKGILRLDLLKTDFFGEKGYPTHLYYNPWENEKSVKLAGGSYYDLITGTFFDGNSITIPGTSSRVLVKLPIERRVTREKNKTLVNGRVIDYRTKM